MSNMIKCIDNTLGDNIYWNWKKAVLSWITIWNEYELIEEFTVHKVLMYKIKNDKWSTCQYDSARFQKLGEIESTTEEPYDDDDF